MRRQARNVRGGGISRRELLKTAGAGAAVAAGAGIGLFGGRAPAMAQEVTLHVTQLTNFVPEIDRELLKLAKEFEASHKCKMEMEFIDLNGVMAKAVSSIEAATGPDIFLLQWNQAQIFGEKLVDVGALVKKLGGPSMHKVNRDAVLVDGVYRGVPIYNVASAMTYNKTFCDSIGITEDKYAKTYDDLHRIGTAMKKAGRPIGWCLGHTIGDGAFGNYPIIWAFGGAESDEHGNIIINSKGTREALKWMIAFWKDACDEGGMGWNDASNNQAFLSESVGCVLNAASIYVKTRRDAREAKEKGDTATYEKWTAFANKIRHTVPPKGPAGQYVLVQPYAHHITGYSKNQNLAKEWLLFIGADKQYERIFTASHGFAQGIAPKWDKHKMWDQDPQMKPYRELNKYSRSLGYKGPYGRGASEAQQKYIIPDMLARAIQGNDVEAAIQWGESELKIAYAPKSKKA